MHRLLIILILAAVVVGSMGSGASSKDQTQVPSKVQKGKKAIMTTHANGTFEVKLTMNRGAPQLSVTVVPDSGTGQLVGLAGKMDIKIADGKHFYDFEYTLAETP